MICNDMREKKPVTEDQWQGFQILCSPIRKKKCMGTCEGRDNQNELAHLKKSQAIICTNSRLQQTNTQIEQRLENLLAKS